jgi:hypothetical protein
LSCALKRKQVKFDVANPFERKVDGCGPVEEFWDAQGHQFNQTHFHH